MDELRKHNAKKSQEDRQQHIVGFHLTEIPRTHNSTRREQISGRQGLRVGENEEWLLMGTGFHSGEMTMFWQWWWLGKFVNIPKITELYTCIQWILHEYISIKKCNGKKREREKDTERDYLLVASGLCWWCVKARTDDSHLESRKARQVNTQKTQSTWVQDYTACVLTEPIMKPSYQQLSC